MLVQIRMHGRSQGHKHCLAIMHNSADPALAPFCCPTDPERRDVALKTVKEGRLVMQGPMMLSQGYFGVVGRKPVYITPSTANETFG